jgi:hypothetical protein
MIIMSEVYDPTLASMYPIGTSDKNGSYFDLIRDIDGRAGLENLKRSLYKTEEFNETEEFNIYDHLDKDGKIKFPNGSYFSLQYFGK